MSTLSEIKRLQADVGELLERHERHRHHVDFAKYAGDPVGFIRELLHGEPWTLQMEVATAVRDEPFVVVRSCNSAGKDWLAARLALWWVYARRGQVLITGPTERQVKAIVFGQIRRAFSDTPVLPGDLYELELRVDRTEEMGILGFTSNDASKLTGFHAPRVLVVITEAQAVEPFAWEAMFSCATGDEDRILAVGNPLVPLGKFFDVSRSPAWHSFRVAAFDHPNLTEGRSVIRGGVTKQFVETMAREYGEDSSVYRARVLGEFPTQAEDALARREWLEAAAEIHSRQPFSPEGPRFSLDPARYGSDKTVLAVRRGSRVEAVIEWRHASTMETAGRVVETMRRLGALETGLSLTGRPPAGDDDAAITIDEVGLGGGIVDRLRELGYAVEAFNGARAASGRESERFLNLRAAAYWHLRRLLEQGRIGIAKDERLWEELLGTQWTLTSSGKLAIEPKEDIRGRLGRSPDRADAVSMLFWGYGRARPRPRVPSTSYWDLGGGIVAVVKPSANPYLPW